MEAQTAKLTPMMERYLEVKRENPGTLLLFRMGDFYEMFYEDAEIAARVLGITLTSRDKSSANPIPMAGFPYHALDGYLQKLIRNGLRAAICDQVEDPKKAKGLVRREVTRVVTPGTLTDDQLLDPVQSNFLAALSIDGQRVGLSWLELSTGRFLTSEISFEQLPDELARIQPAELLVPELSAESKLRETLLYLQNVLVTERPAWSFSNDESRRLLLKHFQTRTLEGFDVDDGSAGITAAGVLLEYVQETQRSALGHITRIESYRTGQTLRIDEATRRSLELNRTMREGGREGSLLSILDETVTAMGARLLGEWLSNPLTNLEQIQSRLDAVEELIGDVLLCRETRDLLDETYDLQRLTARVATGRCSPRDLGCLGQTLALIPRIRDRLGSPTTERLKQVLDGLDDCPETRSRIESTLVDEPPLQTTEGGIVRTGFHEELDELRDLARGGKEWIAAYQARESERTGIPNLKIGFNKVFGYYLEVTAAHADKVPEDYIRKQTLKNQERYITPELKEHEEKVLRSEERSKELEQQLFQELREAVAAKIQALQATATVLSELDVFAAFATLSVNQGYCRPEITSEPVLDIREGRHPVLDRLQPSGEFVPNDVRLGNPEGRVQIITGPNMAGKSTYIRQAALLTVMAQIGSFVPASEARIGIADSIFARVGASDELGKGQSTFMVEMTETARILNSATASSLVILDEIGRGTSTYDGISLAWAVTEHLHDTIECRTMFATHYHELTELTQTLKAASNWNVAVKEDNEEIIFLHKIVEGTADKSYGIHVARLAGVPDDVIQRARVILDTLEADHLDDRGRPTIPKRQKPSEFKQLSLFGAEDHPLLDDLRELDLDQMTPLAALEKLHSLKGRLGSPNPSDDQPAS